MAISKVGINFTKLNNLTFPEFNSTKTASDYLREMPEIANQQTNYLFGWGIIIGLFVTFYTIISDRLGDGGFGYDELRAYAIASGMTTIFGLLLIMVGYLHDFKPVGVMVGLFIVGGLVINYIENKG